MTREFIGWRIPSLPTSPVLLWPLLLLGISLAAGGAEMNEAGSLMFTLRPEARFAFAGPVGERVQANLEHWLLRAPQANPGMIGMFQMRDREPAPNLMPWAGEFVGKYLISAVQSLRLSDDARLREQVARVVSAFLATQADDGYLGPFPRKERLRGHWDLWGHYHAILALLLWHEHTGDAAALAAARRAADLVCATYLDTGRRVLEAGDPEMNMSILTGLAMLHRITGEPRYLRMAREVEKDWQRAGDYLRAGLDGREFFLSPRPRWESLHDLQGLLELWRVTGDARYREAFVHHWRSIRRWDRRNTGGFSSGEQATGNPYAPTAIETCCTVAWMALTVDYLQLTGDVRAADDLELATLNAGIGAQHASGRWWTYNTPMDGVREASAHTIVFQARAGTPELNCCSVNGPRVLGMLSEWAMMSAADGVVVNWLGSGQATFPLSGGEPFRLVTSGEAWRDGIVVMAVAAAPSRPFRLHLRIPAWARRPRVLLNRQAVAGVTPGKYLELDRTWAANDVLELNFDVPMRVVPGANEAAGKVSVYRGPVLLAFDPAQNSIDESALPALDLSRLDQSKPAAPSPESFDRALTPPPWLALEVPTVRGGSVRLVDFASAGKSGSRYRTWLDVSAPPPAPAFTRAPADAARVPAGPVLFQWSRTGTRGTTYRIEVSDRETFDSGNVWSTNVMGFRCVLDAGAWLASGREPTARRWWRVVSLGPKPGPGGESIPDVPPAWFMIDPSLPPQAPPPEPVAGPAGEIIAHSLRGDETPAFGAVDRVRPAERAPDGTEVNGRDQLLVYAVPAWPEEEFTVSVRVRLREMPKDRIGQIFSGWVAGQDDPLRLVVDGGKVFARIESGGNYSTPGAAISPGAWHAVAAVKSGTSLTLYLDGAPVGSCAVPGIVSTRATDCALGGNPHYGGNEFLAARFADFRFFNRALSSGEVRDLAGGR